MIQYAVIASVEPDVSKSQGRPFLRVRFDVPGVMFVPDDKDLAGLAEWRGRIGQPIAISTQKVAGPPGPCGETYLYDRVLPFKGLRSRGAEQ